MKYSLILLALLAGCAGQQKIVYKDHYVMKEIPSEYFVIPQAYYIDLNTASQKEVSQWILEDQKRDFAIEDKLLGIKALQDDYRKQIEDLNKKGQ